ncbi:MULTISPECIES: amino acid ABC transporter permease [unclassified Pseudodesulfovibrio]|uniref:amino acid ABC transporter permease n=1 Tax=unclassified Pseudodesulfovibrio TaxID=2661612 RepID=UPI000FEBCFBC|nr:MULTISPECIES: amino acid ABC transporter permease [unclassified Pseudodesulfovibrio]MCJ2163247.1 amino acid ABC transporter permease [Pseudodesulfovibrio sp. S3-i]RWU07229.1 amino acid ABC transporter permease [Pseudodesulfovibrio sp. S3]
MHWDIPAHDFTYFLYGNTVVDFTFPFIHNPEGLVASVILAIFGIFGAFWIGLAAGLMRLSRRRWVKLPAVAYIEMIRGMPLLLLIFWFYYMAPVVTGQTMPAFTTTMFCFMVFTGAYVGEIVRAGVLALPKGQMEAARSTGLSNVQAMQLVILPQALRNMIPSFVNQFVSLTKDTSLAAILGVIELTRTGVQVDNREMVASFEVWITIAALYFTICYVLTSYSRRLEAQLSRYQARDR